ncbi:MAG: hypothetical protein WC395_05240 [Bacteroidales bacterium]|jgi:hypothetical protein
MPDGYLVSVLRTQEFGIQEMIDLTLRDFPELDFSMLESVTDLFNLELKVRGTAISYNTTDPGSNPVIASGIIPDLLGRGVSKDLPQPFLLMDHSGKVCYDTHLAAMEYCSKYTQTPLPASWYALNLDYSQVFTGDLLTNRITWLDRTRNAGQMRALTDPDLHTYMHPDFFTVSLHSMAEEWHTKTRLYLGHAKDDLSVPFSETQALYDNLKTKADVTLITGNGGHYNYGIEFFITACLYLTVN